MRLNDRISEWMKRQLKAAKANGFLIGLSGGIDSAVVAALAKKAAAENVLCLILPCQSLKQDERDARMVADCFAIPWKRIDLSPVYDAFCQQLPEGGLMCQANLKPRLRMTTLYYFANKLNFLVVGTGNKSERFMGYFTKFGDGGSDLLPIADLTKTQVKKLAEELKIPRRIIQKPPSAGLWAGQTDEEEMGIHYKDLDGIIISLERRAKTKGRESQVGYVKKMNARSRHKRSLPPIFHLPKS
jgi:NAD+ synthase